MCKRCATPRRSQGKSQDVPMAGMARRAACGVPGAVVLSGFRRTTVRFPDTATAGHQVKTRLPACSPLGRLAGHERQRRPRQAARNSKARQALSRRMARAVAAAPSQRPHKRPLRRPVRCGPAGHCHALSGRTYMHNTLARVRSAWEDFMSDSPISTAVRPVVLESWKRSRAQQAPAQSARTQVLGLQARREISLHSAELLRVADPVLQQAQKWLASSQSMLILTDMQGAVLRVSGDSRTMRQGQEIGLQQGGCWRERDIGTNAIGTALAVNAPVRIHAFEHFCQHVQPWSCAAAPVRDPHGGRLLGVVDISSAASYANEHSLAYATVLAQQIHGQLRQLRQEQHQRILQHLLDQLIHWQGRAIIAFDHLGQLIHSNAPQALRDTPLQAQLAADAQGRLALLARTPPAQWLPALHTLWPEAHWHIVHSGREPIGVWAALPQRLRRSQRLGLQEDAALAASPAVPAVHCAPANWQRPPAFDALVGHSAALRRAIEQAAQIAQAGLPVLLEGETGTGKELFAQAIHAASRGQQSPFVPVNCGGLPQELIGSEIFGYERGAFTGAAPTGRAGKLEAAHGGTLCLDEIGEMPLNLQPYLLRVLEDRQVWRIGSHSGRAVDVQLIAMTNRDLEGEIQAGRFRQDLFYRIAVARLRIPPLRERAEDIPALVAHFAQRCAEKAARALPQFTPAALQRLQTWHWPGNIRQLRNTVENLLLCSPQQGGSGWIDAADLHCEPGLASAWPASADAQGQATLGAPHGGPATAPPDDLQTLEIQTMQRVIAQCQGNLSAAARQLGIARSTLYSRLRKLR
ncbi:sigma-54-dependent Fis family transcriptional regulator [Vandammella animalimorsus]|uniref:Sigma-54-dependent Fis family transcriptional regulator n=2 Tax=Vandammella animalimorsus TaxID=2029117 RepID=A0A3M6R996_9BURK|nr:sigma-54-dependent Fis family transcriptional regulator [Vandammella animalimorsus]